MMRDHTLNTLPDDVQRMLTQALPDQIARLLRDVATPQRNQTGGNTA